MVYNQYKILDDPPKKYLMSMSKERTVEESPAEEKTVELFTAIWPKNRSYFFQGF